MRNLAAAASVALLLAAVACTDHERAEPDRDAAAKRALRAPAARIVGSWVIDKAAQRAEVERVSPGELEDFEESFRANFASIRETFHRDGRYEITNPLGGPYADRWELVSEGEDSVTIRSSGHTWVARRSAMGAGKHERTTAVLTYTFTDPDHMFVTTRMPVFGNEQDVAFFFVRED